jgi:hypothetical protein
VFSSVADAIEWVEGIKTSKSVHVLVTGENSKVVFFIDKYPVSLFKYVNFVAFYCSYKEKIKYSLLQDYFTIFTLWCNFY